MFESKLLKAFRAGGLLAICATMAHAQAGVCKDPWITQAIHQLYNRAPAGSGATGECDITRYGNGHWTTYQDLTQKIVARNGAPHPVAAVQPATSLRPNTPGVGLAPSSSLAGRSSLISDAGGNAVTRGNGIISQDGGGIVAQGGGNIVAQGGGNIVAQGGGNMRSLQSVDKPRAPAGKYLVIPGLSLVDANGNVVRQAGTYTIVVTNGVSKLGAGGRTPVAGTIVTP